MRLALIILGAVGLAAIDQGLKARLPTSEWLVHGRSAVWLALSFLLIASCALLAHIRSRLVMGAATFAAGGLLGNLVSALMNDGGVPDPLLIGGVRHGIAFNLADVFFIIGLLGLAVAAFRNRPSALLQRRLAARSMRPLDR